MNKNKVPFPEVKVGKCFKYDGELFQKVDDNIVWSIRTNSEGEPYHYKEWYLPSEEKVELVTVTEPIKKYPGHKYERGVVFK